MAATRRKQPITRGAIAIVLAVVATACGGSDEPASEPAPENEPAAEPAAGSGDGGANISISGSNTYSGDAEVLCGYDPAAGALWANFFATELNDAELPVATINTIGEFDGSAGGGAVALAQFTPDAVPVFAGPAEGEVTYTGSADSVQVSGTGTAGDGSTVSVEGSCTPTIVTE